MRTEKMLSYLLIFSLINASIGAANPGQICMDESESRHYFSSGEGQAVFCTGILPDKNRLRLPNQCNEEILEKKALYLSGVKGILHKYSWALFPHVRKVIIERSQIEKFSTSVKIGTTLHIVESTFPNITFELMGDNMYCTTLGLHSNINQTIQHGSFRNSVILRNLIIYNQSLLELHGDSLTGLTSLRKLVLNRNGLSRIHEDVFEGLQSLRYINLNHNPLKCFTPKLHHLPRIERISLADTKLMQLSLRLFIPVGSLKTLWLPTTYLSERNEVDLLYTAIAFPNLKCVYWNSIEENITHLERLVLTMESSGLHVVDTKKSNDPVNIALEEEAPYPEVEPYCLM